MPLLIKHTIMAQIPVSSTHPIVWHTVPLSVALLIDWLIFGIFNDYFGHMKVKLRQWRWMWKNIETIFPMDYNQSYIWSFTSIWNVDLEKNINVFTLNMAIRPPEQWRHKYLIIHSHRVIDQMNEFSDFLNKDLDSTNYGWNTISPMTS